MFSNNLMDVWLLPQHDTWTLSTVHWNSFVIPISSGFYTCFSLSCLARALFSFCIKCPSSASRCHSSLWAREQTPLTLHSHFALATYQPAFRHSVWARKQIPSTLHLLIALGTYLFEDSQTNTIEHCIPYRLGLASTSILSLYYGLANKHQRHCIFVSLWTRINQHSISLYALRFGHVSILLCGLTNIISL